MSSFPDSLPDPPEEPILDPENGAVEASESPALELVGGGAAPLMADISEEELAAALLNPVTPEIEPGEEEPEPTEEEIAELTAALHERYPDIQGQIDAFNAKEEESQLDLDAIKAEATTVVDQTMVNGGQTPETTTEINELVSQSRETVAEAPADDAGPMSDADIAALFEQVQAAEPVTPAEPADENGALNPDEIAAMFARAEPAPAAPAHDSATMSPDEIAAMFAEAQPEAAAPAADSAAMSPDEIAAMFAEADSTPVASAVPATADSDDAPMSLEEIQNLVMQSESLSAAPAPASAPAAPEDDLKILGMDDLQNMLERGASLTAPTADLKPQEEAAPAVAAGIPMVDADADFGGFDATEPMAMMEEPEATPTEAPVWDPEVIARVPMALAVAALALPLRFEDGKLVCLVADPIDYGAVGKISEALHCMVDTRPAPITDVVRELRAAYAHADATSARLAMDATAHAKPSLVKLAVKLWKKVA